MSLSLINHSVVFLENDTKTVQSQTDDDTLREQTNKSKNEHSFLKMQDINNKLDKNAKKLKRNTSALHLWKMEKSLNLTNSTTNLSSLSIYKIVLKMVNEEVLAKRNIIIQNEEWRNPIISKQDFSSIGGAAVLKSSQKRNIIIQNEEIQ